MDEQQDEWGRKDDRNQHEGSAFPGGEQRATRHPKQVTDCCEFVFLRDEPLRLSDVTDQ